MVTEIIKRRKSYYVCDECGLGYAVLKWARKCQLWHAKHRGCNLEVIKYAINVGKLCMFCGAKIKRRIRRIDKQ